MKRLLNDKEVGHGLSILFRCALKRRSMGSMGKWSKRIARDRTMSIEQNWFSCDGIKYPTFIPWLSLYEETYPE